MTSALPPSSPAAYTAQSVAAAAVSSPQPAPTATQAQPQAAAQPSQPQPAPAAQPKKQRSRPAQNGAGGYDSKQKFGGKNAGGNKGQQHVAGAPQPQQQQLYLGGQGAAAAVGMGAGNMQPLMFAYPPIQAPGQVLGGAGGAPQGQASNAVGVALGANGAPIGVGYPAYMAFPSQPSAAGASAGAAPAAAAPLAGAAAPAAAAVPSIANGVAPAAAAGSAAAIAAAAAAAEGTLRKVIKVSSKSNVKSVAGAISHTTRAGESPTLMATGSESVNQAVKAIAIARGYLAENKLDVSCQPVFRNQEKGAITFVLSKGVLRGKRAGEDDDIQQLRVARGSDPNAVAGSIANKVRNGERVLVQSIGPGSVDITVRAITLARRFLEGDAIDVCFRPEFIHVKLDEGERSAVKFTILAQQV